MARISGIKEHMEVIGADGVHVGTVDKLEGDRIKLTKKDSGQGGHQGHHHYLSVGLVADVEGDKVRLSTTGANAFMFQEENDGSARYVTDERSRAGAGGRSVAGLDQSTLGWTALALGALAGATYLARNGARRDDRLKLQTDENLRLISSEKVEGTPVVGRNGDSLGKIQSFMVDKYTGRVAYAVMSFGGTMGFGESLFPLPWDVLTYDTDKDGYVLAFTKEQLADAPRFTASDAPEFDVTYRRSLAGYYNR